MSVNTRTINTIHISSGTHGPFIHNTVALPLSIPFRLCKGIRDHMVSAIPDTTANTADRTISAAPEVHE